MNESEASKKAVRETLLVGFWRGLTHTLGVAVMATLIMLPFLSELTLQAIWSSSAYLSFWDMTWVPALLHLLAAGGLWALVVLIFDVVRAKRKPVRKLLRVGKGTVMTETLIILPVLLMLIFGIAQLAVNNMAGIVANAAVFQAGRTAWLWSSEAEGNRRGVTATKAEEMARVQAAAVLTPVAPGDYVQSPFGGSDEFKSMRGILVGSQLPFPSSDLGQVGKNLVPLLFTVDSLDPSSLSSMGGNVSGMTSVPGEDSSYVRALDMSGFRSRTVRKFTFAYKATSVELIEEGDEVGASLVYRHQQAFPLVGRIFGEFTTVSSRPDYYVGIQRKFTMPKQIPPNPTLP